MSVIYNNEGFVWEAIIMGGLLLLPNKTLNKRSRYVSIVSNDDESPITESIQMKRWSNGWEPWLLTKLSRFESHHIVLFYCVTQYNSKPTIVSNDDKSSCIANN